MKKTNVAINGFGRIGRAAAKIIATRFPELRLVAINDLGDPATLAQLLKHDSCYGTFPLEVKAGKDNLLIGRNKVPVFSLKDPSQLPWEKLGVDVVLECTGKFRSKADLGLHLKAGARKVILSAPAKGGGVKTIVLGVNDKKLGRNDNAFSCASCTTNCLAPATAVIKEKFGIKRAIMTTIHAYTADQNLVDGPHKDLRRARAAAINIVPTSTGAATATAETIPSLKGNFDGLAVRVPVAVGSLCDVTYLLKKKTSAEDINRAFAQASRGKLKGILEASKAELVSSDIVGNPHSSIVDLSLTNVIGGDLAKVVAWYDNEWGYANRLVELASYVRKYLK